MVGVTGAGIGWLWAALTFFMLVRMTTVLRASRRAVMLRQAVPWIAGIALVGAGAYYWQTQRKT